MADRIIKKIREITDKPVTHVIISHWHGDHNFGIHRYVEEFPNVQIVSHSFTHEVMTGTRIRYIDGNKNFMPGYKKTLQERLASNKDANGDPLKQSGRDYYERVLDDADMIHENYNNMKVTVPTKSFAFPITASHGQSTFYSFIRIRVGSPFVFDKDFL
jgi:methyl coenzyme M reductase gamma subunit